MKNELLMYLNQNRPKKFNELLFSFIDNSGLKDSEVYKNGDVDRRVFSKIRCRDTYIPKKNTIIKLGLALKLNKDNLCKLLNAAGYSLTNEKFDLVISYFLEKDIHDINLINDYLYSLTNTVL